MDELLFDGLPFTRELAEQWGLRRHRLRTLVTTSVVRLVLPRVFVDAGAADTLALRTAAASLVMPHDAVLSGVAAAWLYGVPVLLPAALRGLPQVEVLRDLARAATRHGGVGGRVAVLPDDDVAVQAGVRVTSPVRTALDLARRLDRPDGLAYLDAMRRAQLVDLSALRTGLERLAGFEWVVQARELVELSDPRAESPGESWMRLRWIDDGLPRLRLQIPLLDGDREAVRLDSGLEEIRFGLEYDGKEWHGPEQAEHDAARRQLARSRWGWDVLAVGKEHVLGRSHAFEELIARRTGLVPRPQPWAARRKARWERIPSQRWAAT